MPDVLKLLPPFEWRGRKYPCTGRTVNFSHEAVQHKLQYRDGEIIEQTGARNPTFSYSVPMREDIARGPYKNLFTEALPALFRDMRRRDPGPLTDPVYGPFVCVPTSFSDEADPQKRDGVDVKIEFLLAPEVGEDEELKPNTLQGVESDAGALDQDIKRANWHQEAPPDGTTDIFSAVNAIAFTGQRAIDKVSGLMNDVAFRLEKIENTVDRLTDPRLWPLRRDSRRLRDAVHRAAELQNPTRRIVTVVLGIRQTLSAIASDAGMSVDDLLKQNPALARTPLVAAGTPVRILARQ